MLRQEETIDFCIHRYQYLLTHRHRVHTLTKAFLKAHFTPLSGDTTLAFLPPLGPLPGGLSALFSHYIFHLDVFIYQQHLPIFWYPVQCL